MLGSKKFFLVRFAFCPLSITAHLHKKYSVSRHCYCTGKKSLMWKLCLWIGSASKLSGQNLWISTSEAFTKIYLVISILTPCWSITFCFTKGHKWRSYLCIIKNSSDYIHYEIFGDNVIGSHLYWLQSLLYMKSYNFFFCILYLKTSSHIFVKFDGDCPYL